MRPLPALLVDVVIHHLAQEKKWEFPKIRGIQGLYGVYIGVI